MKNFARQADAARAAGILAGKWSELENWRFANIREALIIEALTCGEITAAEWIKPVRQRARARARKAA